MKILVIAANGRTGKHVVHEAITRGYQVTAFVRGDYTDAPEEITVIQGDAMSQQDIKEAVKGVDVVVSTIGHVRKSPSNLQTKTIQNCIEAIASSNIKLISLTGSGVRVPDDTITLIDRILNFSIALIDKPRINDGIDHFNRLAESDINWSVLRVLKLTNGSKQAYSLSDHGPVMTLSSRKTVASALLDMAESDDWKQKAPLLSK